MPNVLHLSDTTLSGSPIRISKLLNKHSSKYKSRHMVWQPVIGKRVFETDMVSSEMTDKEIMGWFEWADIIHYHNRYARQEIFKKLEANPAFASMAKPPNKPSVIQIHSPRQSEDFSQEVASGVPLAVIAQYHPREWPELTFIVPNVVDITEPEYLVPKNKIIRNIPIVSYSPSNTNARGWDDKGYGIVNTPLKKLGFDRKIIYQKIVDQPHNVALQLKKSADIGIDEIATGSYHLSSLEYMAMGIPCFARLDGYTSKIVRDLTGSSDLPWMSADRDSFLPKLMYIVASKSWVELGQKTRKWMETYWSPQVLVKHYEDMYDKL